MQLGKKMVQSGKKMVQSGKNETCDSRPGAPEVLLVNRGGVCAALDPVLLGYRGRKRCTALDSVLLGGPVRRMHGPRPGALGGPGRRSRCS